MPKSPQSLHNSQLPNKTSKLVEKFVTWFSVIDTQGDKYYIYRILQNRINKLILIDINRTPTPTTSDWRITWIPSTVWHLWKLIISLALKQV